MKKLLFLFLPGCLLAISVSAYASEKLYRTATVHKNFDDTYAMVEKLQNNHHYGQSMQCVKYPKRGECVAYNSMANQNAFYIYIDAVNETSSKVAVYTTDLVDKRGFRELDDFFKSLYNMQ